MTARWIAAALCAGSIAAAGCGISDPSNNTTDKFSGLLDPLGFNTHQPINVNKTGEVTVTVTALSPTTNVSLGIVFGQLAGSTCANSLGYFTTFGVLNRTAISAGNIPKGTYCVGVFDAGTGNVPSTVSYTISVQHP
jgi:hypothetical protein